MSNVSQYPKITQEQVVSISHVLFSSIQSPDYLVKSGYSALMQKTITDQLLRLQKFINEHKKVAVSEALLEATGSPVVPRHSVTVQNKLNSFSEPTHAKLTVRELANLRKTIEAEIRAEYEAKMSIERMKQQTKEAEDKVRKSIESAENEDNVIAEMYTGFGANIVNRPQDYQDDYGILFRLEKMIRSVERIANKGGTDTAKLTATTKLMEYQEKQISILERLLNINKVDQIEKVTRKFFLELKKHPDLTIVATRYLSLLDNM